MKLMALECNVDTNRYSKQELGEKIEAMRAKISHLQAKRNEVKTGGVPLQVNEDDYQKRLEALQEKITNALTRTTSLTTTAVEWSQQHQPNYTKGLSQLKETMRTLERKRDELDQQAVDLFRGMEELEELNKEVVAFSNEAVEEETHQHGDQHGKNCPCDSCVFETQLTSNMITIGSQQYL